jgi:hypothetical protein
MTKKLALLAALLPLTTLAQPYGGGRGPGPGPGPDDATGPGSDQRIEKMERRARLARNLGLAEALDLDTAQATKLADALAKIDEKRVALHKQMRDARQLLRKAADGEKVSAADVDGAIAKVLDVRTQSAALDKEMLAIVTKDLSPEKKARAALFLGRFEQRMGPGGPGMMGPGGGMGPGMGPGRDGRRGPPGRRGQGPGMGRGEMSMAPPCGDDCPWDDGEDAR